MHLSYSVSNYKGKYYKSYAIAESYRDGNTVRKRILWKIGKLSDEQARKIRLICQAAQDQEQFFTQLDHIVVKETRSYLDLAVVNELWKRLQLDDAFTQDVTLSDLPTQTVARILTINRCLDPLSHYSIPQWVKANALKEVLNLDLSGLNDDKLYYELDKIFVNQSSIEDHIFKLTYQQAPESYRFVDYDLTTSYFVGHRCELSAFGKGKIECHGRRQVLLGVLINQQGYPFKWDVFPGNTAEVKTLKQNIDACKQRFHLNDQNVTLVFDRGIISAENAEEVEAAGLKYISALDNNQIPACGVDLKPFAGLPADIDTDDATDPFVPIPKGFKPYDDTLCYRDDIVIGSKRHIVGFNPGLFKDERRLRQLKLDLFDEFLAIENQKLQNAQKSRKSSATRGRIVDELNRLKIRKYFHEPVLHDIILEKKLKDGTSRSITSFQVAIERKNDVIATEKLTDGVCVFITNHIERKGRGFKTPAQTIIKAYRGKTKVEDVFKNVKSFLKLRPFFVNTTMHVKAVYTICILAYFINRYLANLRKELGEKDFLNSRELYAPFRDIDIALLEDIRNKQTAFKAVQLPDKISNLIERLQMGHILWQKR